MKKVLIATLSILALSACSILNQVGQYANDNPIIVDAATRQAVFRYIDAADTEADKGKRAAAIIDTVEDVDAFLQGNPMASVAGLLEVVEANVKWEKLKPADRLLVQDILALVRLNLQNKQDEGLLDPQAAVGIRALLSTIIRTAQLL